MLAGGAPLSKEVHDFMRVCVGAPLLQGYGLTETCACATLMDVEDLGTEEVGTPNQGMFFNIQKYQKYSKFSKHRSPIEIDQLGRRKLSSDR